MRVAFFVNLCVWAECNKTQRNTSQANTDCCRCLSPPLSHISLSLSLHLTWRPEGFVSSAVWFAPRGDLVCSPQCSIYGLRFSSRPSTAPEQRAICLPQAKKKQQQDEKNSASTKPARGPAALFFQPVNKKRGWERRDRSSLHLFFIKVGQHKHVGFLH